MKYLIQSRLWVGLGAAFTNLGIAILIGIEPSPQMMVIQFLIFYAIYILNSLSDIREDSINKPHRASYVRQHIGNIIVVATLCMVLALWIALSYGWPVVLGVFTPFIIGLIYSFRCIPISIKPFRLMRLKDLLVIKNLTVAVTWTGSAMVLQQNLHTVTFTTCSAAFWLISLSMFINSMIFDLRDVNADQQCGVHTIPVEIGFSTTLNLAHALNFLFASGILLFAHAGIFSALSYSLLLLSFYRFIYLVVILNSRDSIDFVCDFIVDGEIILFGLVLYLSKMNFG